MPEGEFIPMTSPLLRWLDTAGRGVSAMPAYQGSGTAGFDYGGDQGGLGMAPGQSAPPGQTAPGQTADMTPESMGMGPVGQPGFADSFGGIPGIGENTPSAMNANAAMNGFGGMPQGMLGPDPSMSAGKSASSMGRDVSEAGSRSFSGQPDMPATPSPMDENRPEKDAWSYSVQVNPRSKQMAAAMGLQDVPGIGADGIGGMGAGGMGSPGGIGGGGSGAPGGSSDAGPGSWKFGGYTGDDMDAEQEIAGEVHEKEFVFTEAATNLLGAETLDQVNAIAADGQMSPEEKRQKIAALFSDGGDSGISDQMSGMADMIAGGPMGAA